MRRKIWFRLPIAAFLLSSGYSVNRQMETLSTGASRSGPFQFYNISNFVLKRQFPFPELLSPAMAVPSCPLQASHSFMLSISLAKGPLSAQHLLSATVH